ncbi:hypothetical protein [Rhodococcus sp. HNM0569]|uniref:hypothetical protein n=1 Tax=Rhodococcus sp. HNM0569 TaxID=2716340 RepID=UPI00146BF4C7|nr:hypothetical protein [Rhodococcus sp. HNM0569]NLU83546.1 hypothetical protein [Rhodococcus sp. HNM0569]
MTDRGERGRAKAAESFLTLVLVLVTVAAAGVFLVALAGGYEGWSLIAGIVTLVFAVVTIAVFVDGRRRKRASTIVYTPDSPDVTVEVDAERDDAPNPRGEEG